MLPTVITAPNNIFVSEDPNVDVIRVFLAGGITKCKDWQSQVIRRLEYLVTENGEPDDPALVIYNPRRDKFDINDPKETYRQIEWEYKAINFCNIFSMYFCDSESDQPICMYELGRVIHEFPPEKIVLSVESNYKRRSDVSIQTKLAVGHSIAMESATPDSHAEEIYMRYRQYCAHIKERKNYLSFRSF